MSTPARTSVDTPVPTAITLANRVIASAETSLNVKIKVMSVQQTLVTNSVRRAQGDRKVVDAAIRTHTESSKIIADALQQAKAVAALANAQYEHLCGVLEALVADQTTIETCESIRDAALDTLRRINESMAMIEEPINDLLSLQLTRDRSGDLCVEMKLADNVSFRFDPPREQSKRGARRRAQ